MKSIRFVEKIIINEDTERVFDFTQDYKNRLRWDTFLKKADLMDGAAEANREVKAHCVATNGIGMITEYVTFDRPKVTAIKMIKGPYMFATFLGSWTFKEINKTQTEVIFLYSFQLRFPFNLLKDFIRKNLQTNVRQRLSDLKNCVEKDCRNDLFKAE